MKVAVIDFETTGLNPETDYPTEVAVKLVDFDNPAGPQETAYSSMIKLPEGVELSEYITDLTGLTTEVLNEQGTDITTVIEELIEFLGEDCEEETVFVAHNANFDLGFLAIHFGLMPKAYVCTRSVAIMTAPEHNASLNQLYERLFSKGEKQTHRAMGDVEMTFKVFMYYIQTEGPEALTFMVNRLVVMPDRGLVYEPPYARLLDFSKKYEVKKK